MGLAILLILAVLAWTLAILSTIMAWRYVYDDYRILRDERGASRSRAGTS